MNIPDPPRLSDIPVFEAPCDPFDAKNPQCAKHCDETADDTAQSRRAGHRVTIPPPVTIADGLMAEQPGELTFAVNSRLLDDIVTVSEAAIIDAMRFCFTRLKIVAEPSAAVALAALRSGAVPGSGRRTAVVLTGGNIDPAMFAALLAAPSV